jgi:hypothetical protein
MNGIQGGGVGGNSSGVIQKDSLLDFPIVGNPSVLYIALNSNIMYFWDINTNTYVPISNGANENLRGGHDASSNLFPFAGGSGISGAIAKGDYWYVTVADVLGGQDVVVGSSITALVDEPAQIASNWLIIIDSVASVFGRIGNVVAQSGDYTINQITNGLSNALPESNIFVGNALNKANAVLPNNAFNQTFETLNSEIKMDGIASVGTSNNIPKANRVHPSDTSKQNIISTPTTNNLVSVNNVGQVIDSGLSVSTISSTSSDTTLLTSKATQAAIANAITSNESLRGGYNASSNVFPINGGTGTGDAINAGDYWYITVAGTLGSEKVVVGSSITALVDTPGQTANNWLIIINAVDSVYGRTGQIVAQNGDYTISQITNGLSNVLSSANIFVGNALNISTGVPMSADATISNTGAVTIANNAVTNTKLNTMATNTLKGNNTAATANPIDLTSTEITAMLNTVVGDTGLGGTKGLAPAPAAGDAVANKYLKANGTWQAPFTAKQPKITRFTASGTWTPDPTASYVSIQCQGAGGGSSTVTSVAGGIAISTSGGAGSYLEAIFPSQSTAKTVTVGTSAIGAPGGTSSVATLISTPGGNFGAGIATGIIAATTVGGTTGVAVANSAVLTTGTLISEQIGQGVSRALVIAITNSTTSLRIIPNGGNSPLGQGGIGGSSFGATTATGGSGTGFGSGAGGASFVGVGTALGVAGQGGIVIITEYYY